MATNVIEEHPDNDGWTEEWPTKPGTYLFYGGFVRASGDKPRCRFSVCRAAFSGNNRLVLMTESHILYKEESYGVFRPFNIKIPELPRFKED
jgi:hypothetical protein